MILVTGATGLTGSELVRRLSAKGIPSRALVRNPAKATHLALLPNVEVVEGDMARPDSLTEALRGVDRAMLISSSDPTMVETQSSFIDAAKKAGVRHVVKLSGIIPELDSPFRFARMHAEIEQRLEASGVPFTHLRAGEFMPSYFRQVPSIVNRGILALPMADARIASLDIGDLAEVSIAVLTTSGHEGKTYPITGPESLSMSEVAEKLSASNWQDRPVRRRASRGGEQSAAGRGHAALPGRGTGRALRRAPQRQGVHGVADDQGRLRAGANHLR